MRWVFVLTLFQMHQFELSAVGGNWDAEGLMAPCLLEKMKFSCQISLVHLTCSGFYGLRLGTL